MSDIISAFSTRSSVFRIVLPGAIVLFLLWPLIFPLIPASMKLEELTDVITLLALLTPLAVIAGVGLMLMRDIIYRIYEGRLLWQRKLYNLLKSRLQDQIDKKIRRVNQLDNKSMQYKELSYWLRMFPLDEQGKPVAKRPTIVGNVLAGYEEYPLRRYGMDSIFYWYRLSLTLPESYATQIDRVWAEADGLMYVSFASLIIGFLYLLIAAIKWFTLSVMNLGIPPKPTTEYLSSIPPPSILVLLFIALLSGAYVVYRWSIPTHRRVGEYFKAAFDIYRKNILDMTKLAPAEKENWNTTWAYLQ